MQFTPRNRESSTFWRSEYQSPRRAERPPQSREWSSSWSSPKPYFTGRPKYQYRGPNARGYIKNANSNWSRYNNSDNGNNRQSSNNNNNNGFRSDCSAGGGRGRGGWRKHSVGYDNGNKSYQTEESPRWRSPPRRRPSPLRARENESPSPRRPSESPRRGCSPHHGEAKRARLGRSAERSPAADRSGKENAQQVAAAGARRFYGESGGGGARPMRPPPSPRKAGEPGGKPLQLYGGKAAPAARELQLVPAGAASDSDKHGGDPLYIGLPNFGNSCYQNATLQSLLGLRPFLSEMMALIAGLEGDQCRTLRAVAKLMVLRQKALSKSVSSHLNDLRDVFAEIDPAFRGTEMQDANEFLLRLLDTIKDELDARRPTANPIRDNFQYQTVESYMCTKCHETVLKRQENISWFVSVPRRPDSGETPTLQDALRLSMRPDHRELLCQHCRHDQCRVTTKISQLPRTLILQLNRYVFLGEESRKIRANVAIPKFLSLNEYVADDVTRPPEWNCTKPTLSSLSDFDDAQPPCAPPSTPPPSAPPPSPSARPPPPPASSAELVELDAEPEQKPAPRTREDEDRELQEAIMRSLEEGETAENSAEQAHLSQFCVEDDQSRCSVDLSGANTYRLLGVVSHYGGATHSGHYVSDVYSVGRDRWYHYDDRRVSCVDEADVLGEGHQRNGYIFFYLHKDLCSQVVSAEAAAGGSP